ncbi:MAG: hypothetical protein B6244_12810 [Candidatus Cloacimonetes bacterium 4572_55]|nr:MAG: hypothetical protein B6244_12810 [Candidatus Cloacimonetes bacterium 4572_55]
MKREIPLAITAIFGIFMVAQLFIPHYLVQDISGRLQDWAVVIVAFAYILGVANIIKINSGVICRRGQDWEYKIVMLIALVIMMLSGILLGKDPDDSLPIFDFMYNSMYVPMQSTMFALLAFFIASAAFRAFRARTTEAILLLVTATIVMIGRVSLGEFIWERLPDITEWIMNYPNNAGKRGIKIGASLGAISIGLKVILGIEKSYLGGD